MIRTTRDGQQDQINKAAGAAAKNDSSSLKFFPWELFKLRVLLCTQENAFPGKLKNLHRFGGIWKALRGAHAHKLDTFAHSFALEARLCTTCLRCLSP